MLKYEMSLGKWGLRFFVVVMVSLLSSAAGPGGILADRGENAARAASFPQTLPAGLSWLRRQDNSGLCSELGITSATFPNADLDEMSFNCSLGYPKGGRLPPGSDDENLRGHDGTISITKTSNPEEAAQLVKDDAQMKKINLQDQATQYGDLGFEWQNDYPKNHVIVFSRNCFFVKAGFGEDVEEATKTQVKADVATIDQLLKKAALCGGTSTTLEDLCKLMPSGAKVVESTKVTCTAKVDDAVVYIRLYPTPEEARNDLAARIKDAQKKKPSPWTYTSIKDIGDVGYDARATDGSGKHGVGFVRGPYLVLIETTGTGLDLAEPDARKIDRLLTALVPSTAGATQTGTAQVKTPSGTEKLNTGEKIEINIPSGDRADIEAECENLSYAVMLIEMSNSSIERAQMMGGIFYIWCMKVKYPSPGMSSMIGSGSLCAPWPLQASAGDVQAYLDLELVEGEVLFNVVQEGVTLDVKTGTLVASSTGKSTFDVVYDPAGQQTTVAVRQGSVEIRPANEAVQPFTLSSGEKVDVSADEVGQVTAFEPGFAASATAEPGVKATKTAPEPQPSKGPLGLSNEAWMGIGGACVCGLCGVLVLGLLIVVVWRRRSRPAPLPSPRLVGVAPAAGVDHPSTARLVLAAGRASRPSVDIPLAGLTIGRERANLLSIHDSLASRQHARIDYAAGAWVITDLSSSNGTYVNGMRITRQALQPGDQIQIGGVVLVFQAGKQ